METLAKKRPGRKPKFTLIGVEKAPIKAVGWAKNHPHQYANYWNNRNDTQVQVVFDKRGNAFFELKPLAPT